MIRIVQLTSLLLLFSCANTEQDALAEWELNSSEVIEHFEQGNQKVQVIYSSFEAGLISFMDTSIRVQVFQDTLILEEIQYNIEGGDSIKWFHHINKYDGLGQVIEEIDSVEGVLQHHSLYFYEQSKLVRTEHLNMIPRHNEMMVRVGADTSRSEVLSFYDELGRCARVISLSDNKMASVLTGITKIDSSLTFHQFDDQNRKITSVTVLDGDTTGITRVQYDASGRVSKTITATIDFGVSSLQNEYDDQGNVTAELILMDNFSELTRTEYDSQNRPVKRKIYSQEVSDNNWIPEP